MKKSVKVSNNPYKTGKVPRGGEKADALNEEYFRWRCKSVDLDGNWGVRDVDCETLWGEVIPRLHSFESMRWNEIIGPRSTSDHTMPVSALETPARDRLKELGLEHLENLFQLSIKGKPRIWGYKDRIEFNLLWFDPDHTVYIVGKKGT